MYKITKEQLLYALKATTIEKEIEDELYTAYKELIIAHPLESKEIDLITAVIENSTYSTKIARYEVEDIPFEATIMLAKLFKEKSKYRFEIRRARANCVNRVYVLARDYFKNMSGVNISIKSNRWAYEAEEIENYEERFINIIMSEAVNPKVINKIVDYYFYYTIKKIFLEYVN